MKRQAALAGMQAKTSLKVESLPVANASMEDVERGPTTTPDHLLQPGQNYNPVEPMPEQPEPEPEPPQPEPEPQVGLEQT